MKIFPAIDLKDGKAVRLTQGDYNKVEVFFDNPLDVLNFFNMNNSNNLHIVDLDGAKDGSIKNYKTIRNIVQNSNFFVQVGGGIRDEERIIKYLDLGVNRVILGTVAIENEAFLIDMVNKYGDKIAVGVDAKNQKVAINGWEKIVEIDSIEFCKRLSDIGVKTIIYTDISKDGMLTGTNLEIYKELKKLVHSDIIASGGITFKEEILELAKEKIYGAIVGKAIYSNRLNLKEIIELAK